MEIKVELDLSEIFDENEELNLHELIKERIIRECAVYAERVLVPDIRQEAVNIIHRSMTEHFEDFIKSYFEKLETSSEKIIRHGGVNYSFSEYFKELISYEARNRINNSIEAIVKKNAERIKDELTKRYDMLFATQIVQRMAKTGMLKEGLAKNFLETGNIGGE